MFIKCKTDKGKVRENNQDYIVTFIGKRYLLLVVADGMGGHNAGEVASSMAALTIRDFVFNKFDSYDNIEELLKDAIKLSNSSVYQESIKKNNLSGMGTTATCCLLFDDRLFLGHVGDSRAYLINKVGIVKITQDHSYVQQLIDNGSITENEALLHPQRNLITRAIGTEECIEVDTKTMDINNGDIILLCSDGLTNYVSNNEIFDIVRENIKDAADLLIELAKKRGGNDNISVIIVRKEG